MTRWRSVLERATTRHHMSPGPVIVHASSSSGIVARCRPTASCPPPLGPCRISRVRKAVTGWSSAAGSSWGPQPETTPAGLQPVEPGLDGAAGHPEPAGGLEHAHAGLGGEQFEQGAVELVHRRASWLCKLSSVSTLALRRLSSTAILGA